MFLPTDFSRYFIMDNKGKFFAVVVVGLGIGAYFLYNKNKCASVCTSQCDTPSGCSDQEEIKQYPFLLSEEEYANVVSSACNEAFASIAEGCDISFDEAASRLEANQEVIDNFKSDLVSFIEEKIKIVETASEAKVVKLDIFDQFVFKIKTAYAINDERQQFFDNMFADIRSTIVVPDNIES